jgi:two-component SAPR family response regulator
MLEHILVVEDDEFMRVSLETELQLAGYRVSVAENGRQAVDLAREQHFDLVVSDIRMAGMDGLETLSALREFQPEARSIVITGYADPEAPIAAVRLKVDDYLMKPFTSEEFLRSVRASLEAQLQELRKRRSAQNLRSLWLQSLEQPPKNASEAARRVARLGWRLGLSAARCQKLQLAVWLRELGPELESIEDCKGLIPGQWGENFDGSGPLGLVGSNIPLNARVLRVALDPQDPGCDPELVTLLESAEELPALRSRGVETLLSLAESYLDSSQFEVAIEALDEAMSRAEAPETRVQVWLLRSRLPDGLAAAEQALELSVGLDLLRARAALALARLGSVRPAELRQARQTLLTFERPLLEVDLWLAQSGDGDARTQLINGLTEEPDAFVRWAEPLSTVLSPGPELAAAVAAAGNRALPLLEGWLQAGSALEHQLRALDLLAGIDTPEARILLSRVGGAQPGAVSHKSSLLLHGSGGSAQLFLLGPFRLSAGGRALEDDALATRKTRSLLAYLATRRGQESSEDVLIDLFWEGPRARHSLHNAISQIRKAFKPLLGPVTLLARRRNGYALELDEHLWVDVEQFRLHCDEARRLANPAEAAAQLKKAEALYRGDFLQGFYEDWCEPLRAQLFNQLVQLFTGLGQHYFERGKYEVSLDYWKRLLLRDNCSEDAYLGSVLCQLALGRKAEAVRTYHQCADRLREELNLSPPPKLVEIYLKITG